MFLSVSLKLAARPDGIHLLYIVRALFFIGAKCYGSTTDSKSVRLGSIPSAPATNNEGVIMPVLWAKNERKDTMSICGEIENTRVEILVHLDKLRHCLKTREHNCIKYDRRIYSICGALRKLYKRQTMLEEIADLKPLPMSVMTFVDSLEERGT